MSDHDPMTATWRPYKGDLEEPFPWGKTTPEDWDVWRGDYEPGPARQTAGRLWQVADAYAHGYVKALQDAGQLDPGSVDVWSSAAYAFGHEYERAAWLYATERKHFRDGYARAWEMHLEAKGLR